jgi:hypothetical protein
LRRSILISRDLHSCDLAVALGPSLFLPAAASHESRFVLDRGRERRVQGEGVPSDRFDCHPHVVAHSANKHAFDTFISRLVVRILLHFLCVFCPQFPEEPIPSSFAAVQEVLGAFVLPLLERRNELKCLRLIDDFVESFQEERLQQLPAGRGCRLLVLEEERPTKCLLPERLHNDDCCVFVAQLLDCVETTYLES